MPALYRRWAKQKKIQPFCIVWPTKEVYHDRQIKMTPFPLAMPTSRRQWNAFIRKAVKATMAYALLLVEQQEQAIVISLEDIHGPCRWKIPIVDRVNVQILGKPKEEDGVGELGILQPLSFEEPQED